MIFYILRAWREPVRTRLPNGFNIEETAIRFFPIFSPIDAETAEEAFKLALRIYPNFKCHIAIQSAKDYHAANPPITAGLAGPLHSGAENP